MECLNIRFPLPTILQSKVSNICIKYQISVINIYYLVTKVSFYILTTFHIEADKKQDFETELETCDVRSEATEPPKNNIRDENLNISQVVARYPKCSKIACKNLYLMDTEKVSSLNIYVNEEIC